MLFNPYERIMIEPQSFDVEQRQEAALIASERGLGVRMEIHSSHTEFYYDQYVPAGQIEVWSVFEYKSPLRMVTTLGSADEEFGYPELRVWQDDVQKNSWKPGDACGACGSTQTGWNPVEGGYCLSCGASDADE